MQEENYIVFENYLQNKMNLEEKEDFESKLRNDVELTEKLELYKQANLFLENKFSTETIQFKQNINKISAQYFAEEERIKTKKKTKVIPFASKWFAIAATITIVVSFWIFNQKSMPKYEDYNNHQKIHLTERSTSNIALKEAEVAFNAKDFNLAILKFGELNSLDIEAQLYYGISLIETGNNKKAATILKKIEGGNSVFKEEAIWYLGLLSLKQKKYNEAIDYLKLITENSERFKSAQKLLNDLD